MSFDTGFNERSITGKIVVIWDGSPIHRGREIKDSLKRGAAKRLQLHQLPGYAPHLNPDEGIWNYLKRGEVGQCLLCQSGSVASSAHSGQSAPAAQERDHQKLLSSMWLLALDPLYEINKTYYNTAYGEYRAPNLEETKVSLC